jgi:predicted transcriptional regulator
LILAKDVGYSNSTPFLVTTAIAMARLTDTVAIKHFSDNGLIYVDSARNVSGQYVVNSALTAGPSGECLVVYEKNYKIDSCLIVGRLIRER